jgi:ribonuclease J
MVNHASLAQATGVEAGKVVICEDGDSLVLDDDGISRSEPVPAGFVYVDGTVGDVSHGVLRDRRFLAEEGVVVVVATVDLHAREVVSPPEIVTRGWVHAPEAEELLDEASEVVRVALEKALADGAGDHEALRRHARKALGRLVGERTRRRPMIVPVVVTV